MAGAYQNWFPRQCVEHTMVPVVKRPADIFNRPGFKEGKRTLADGI